MLLSLLPADAETLQEAVQMEIGSVSYPFDAGSLQRNFLNIITVNISMLMCSCVHFIKMLNIMGKCNILNRNEKMAIKSMFNAPFPTLCKLLLHKMPLMYKPEQ